MIPWCYHACHHTKSLEGIAVKQVDFIDPQGGKGTCGRKAASIKVHMQRYINEGHDRELITLAAERH